MGGYSEKDAQKVVLLGSGDGGATWAPVEDPAGGGGVGGSVSVSNWPAVQPVSDNGSSLTVDGTVAVSNLPVTQAVSGTVDIGTMPTVTVAEPVSIDDNGGSITVDGTVTVQDGGATISVDDGAGSLTVDGTVAVSNFPSTYPVTDNGGSLTVDGTVTVQDGGSTISVDDGGGSITIDGTVAVSNLPGGSVPQTWVAVADAVAPAANKHMLSLLNGSGSGKVLKLLSLRLVPLTLTAVTGVGLRMELRKITAHAAGTGVTPVTYDSNNTALPAQVTAYTNSASVTEPTLLWPYTVNNDEIGLTSTTSTPAQWNADIALAGNMAYQQPLTFREGQGFTLKNITSSTIGTFAVVAVFTVE